VKFIDTVADFCSKVSAWLFFIIGGMIVYEVVARYVFLAPTSWSEEMSRFFQIWATYLAAAAILRQRKLIAIDVFYLKMPRGMQLLCDLLSLAIIMIFSAVACYHGMAIVIDSIQIGRSSSGMLAVPLWLTEIAIPIGFGLLLLQALAEMLRTVSGHGATLQKSH